MKKVFSLILASIMTMALVLPASAKAPDSELENFTVTSPDFPDAYIITEYTPGIQYMDGTSGSIGSVSATVFVEENYDIIGDEAVVTDSRLLSKDEVMAIGVENFTDLNTAPAPRTPATSTRGKLTITFFGRYTTKNGVSCNLTGSANWDSSGLCIPGVNYCDTGEDFIGVTWSGSFTSTKHKISGTTTNGTKLKIYNSDSTPNAGRVWSFDDYTTLSKYTYYAEDIDLTMTIAKNTLVGDGNTAEAVLKYIHTYSKVKGSVTIIPGSQTTAGNFSLSNTDNQWSIVCTLTNIPY